MRIIKVTISVAAVSNDDLLRLGDIAHSLRFIEALDAMEDLTARQIYGFQRIVPQRRHIEHPILPIDVQMIDAALYVRQRDRFAQYQLIRAVGRLRRTTGVAAA